ncbi:MAG TPA: glycosyltransferase family 1 protein [Candidatus Limnocylindria bacterium]|nr:glycosyltransferase family 1 protein [Candidatus Limnocylindria bacterium]
MRVVFDARHLQTVSRTRGIGRYSRNLLAAFARRAPDDIAWTLLVLRNFAPADPSPLPPHRTRATYRLRRPELTMQVLDPVLLPFELAGQGDLYHSVQLGLPAIHRRPVVLTIHDLAPLRWPAHYLRLPYARVGHAWQYGLAKRADAIIAVSDATKADVVARLGIAAQKVQVIPEAVDSSFRPPSREAGAAVARERFGVPGRYVLYVGQFDPRKNMDGLFAAFARAAERDRELRLVIVGTLGKLAGIMRDALARSRLDPARVIIAGGVDDQTLAALYAGAECLLHAAWLEGFGLTPLEALAAGTPVVGYAAGAVAEVVGDAGLLVDPAEPDALGEALVTLLGDESLQLRLRERAKPQAARFSWDRAADDTLAVYRTLS